MLDRDKSCFFFIITMLEKSVMINDSIKTGRFEFRNFKPKRMNIWKYFGHKKDK